MILLWSLILTPFSFANTQQDSNAQVLMMGVFHFSSPGKDTVKVKHIDVMSPESQADIQSISQKITQQFKPTLVLLEYAEKNDNIIQGRYQKYLAGDYTLPVNEIYQLGFRIAKASGGVPIASFDERVVGWKAEKLFKNMPSTAPDIQEAFDDTIRDITKTMNAAHKTLSLIELLKMHNDAEQDRKNKDIYVLTNSVSTNGEFEGALAASSWWHRNFRMYAKIQQHASPEERILVIGGQGHTAILKDLLAIDDRLTAIDINSFL